VPAQPLATQEATARQRRRQPDTAGDRSHDASRVTGEGSGSPWPGRGISPPVRRATGRLRPRRSPPPALTCRVLHQAGGRIWTEMLSIWQNPPRRSQAFLPQGLPAPRILPNAEKLAKWVLPTADNLGHRGELWPNRP
jgi:hypothetical protein